MDPRKLYRGLGSSVGNMAILTGVQFPITGLISGVITGGVNRKLSAQEAIGSGFLGGVASGFVCAPMELVMIQQQRFGTNIVQAPQQVVSVLGPAGLWRGLLCSCGREGMYTAGYLGIGPVIKSKALEKGYNEPTAVACGAIIGHPPSTT